MTINQSQSNEKINGMIHVQNKRRQMNMSDSNTWQPLNPDRLIQNIMGLDIFVGPKPSNNLGLLYE